jgi:hypothetical protein
VLVGPAGTINSAGSVLTGNVDAKVLILAALLDIDAYPWQADWYRGRIRESMGERFEDSCAIWFIDNAHHENPMRPIQKAHAVSFGGALQQGLRDLARWVEEGEKPLETRYQVIESQVIVPARASERRGVQPVVTLKANGGARASVAAGDAVELSVEAQVPPGTGEIVAVEWSPLGDGVFVAGDVPIGTAAQATLRHVYDTQGTWFPTVRVTSQREGDAATPYGRVQNITTARVFVK